MKWKEPLVHINDKNVIIMPEKRQIYLCIFSIEIYILSYEEAIKVCFQMCKEIYTCVAITIIILFF